MNGKHFGLWRRSPGTHAEVNHSRQLTSPVEGGARLTWRCQARLPGAEGPARGCHANGGCRAEEAEAQSGGLAVPAGGREEGAEWGIRLV